MRTFQEVGPGDFARIPNGGLKEIESICQPINDKPKTSPPGVPIITTVDGLKHNPFQVIGFFKRSDLGFNPMKRQEA